ncbi:MAG: DNA helicase, partial [Ignavibacteria bacterium]|nr:DNA helicase [Ignavibacteria bacterium]
MLKLNENLSIVRNYYTQLETYHKFGISNETSVREAFKNLLEYCCKKTNLQFVAEYSIENFLKGSKIIVDGAFFDFFKIPHGYWEAKDTADDLYKEIQAKFQKGYPSDNII